MAQTTVPEWSLEFAHRPGSGTAMALRYCFVTLLALACSSTPPAQSADDVTPPATEFDEPSSGPTEPAEAESATEAASSEPVSADELQSILQLVIDDDALEPYLRLDLPERHPLRVAGENLPPGLELRKGPKPAQILDLASIDAKQPVLVFTEISVKGNKASVAYRYDVEKVRGSASLSKADGAWTLDKSRVTVRELNAP